MLNVINPWDLGKEQESKPSVPTFAKAKYLVTKVKPPKGKTIRDGIVVTAAMISYEDVDGKNVSVTSVTKDENGKFSVEFPLGKYLVLATKYRGPKSYYRFLDEKTGKFKLISQDKFTVDYAKHYLSNKIPGWSDLDPSAQDVYIDEYFEDMYMFGMANDFAMDTTKDYSPITPGISTYFYRRYTPPAKDEKYGNVIITKWPSRKSPEESAFPDLTGDYEMVSQEIVNAINEAYEKRNEVSYGDEAPF